MFKDESDFDYFLYKAKKDGATNERIYAVLNEYYGQYAIDQPSYVSKWMNKVEKDEYYQMYGQYHINMNYLKSFYFGEGCPLNMEELCQLKDFFKRGLMQINKQIESLKEISNQ